jgi:hypothetical protein
MKRDRLGLGGDDLARWAEDAAERDAEFAHQRRARDRGWQRERDHLAKVSAQAEIEALRIEISNLKTELATRREAEIKAIAEETFNAIDAAIGACDAKIARLEESFKAAVAGLKPTESKDFKFAREDESELPNPLVYKQNLN